MLTALRDAKRNGASVVSINPLKEAGMGRFKHPQNPIEVLGNGTEIADCHLNVRINGDMALFRGLAKTMISKDLLDDSFIHEQTHGFDDYKAEVSDTDWLDIERFSAISREAIENLGESIGQSKSMIVIFRKAIDNRFS